MASVDTYLQKNWKPSDMDGITLVKAFIKEFNIDTFIQSFYKSLESLDGPLKARCVDFVNKQIFNSKSWTDQQQLISSEAISFTHHDEMSGAVMQQCRVFKQDMELKCVTIHHSDDNSIKTHHRKFKAAVTSLKHKICCNHSDLTTPSNRYMITTWSLSGDPQIKQQLTMTHGLRVSTKASTVTRMEMDPSAQYICIIHSSGGNAARINIISRLHLIQNHITEIDETELQREGVQIDDESLTIFTIFDVQWFRNKRCSQNLLLGVAIKEHNRFKFTIIDCVNKRVRRRVVDSHDLNYQFLKYPRLSVDTLWGVCDNNQSKEISIGIMESLVGSTKIGLEKFAQYYLLRKSANQSRSWVKGAPNGRYLVHFSGMDRDKKPFMDNMDVSYRLGVIKIPDHSSVDDDSDVTITFHHKPCGFTINCDENKLNACIAKISDDNVYIKDGLELGLWIHTINMKVVDNNSYQSILGVIRRSPTPLTIGFKYGAPSKAIAPQKLGVHFWYNTPLKELGTDTVCNGIHWLNNDTAVCVIGSKLYVLGQNMGARWRTKVLDIWMKDAYGMVNRDMRGIVHTFVGFDLDHVYNISDLKSKNNEKTVIDFYYSKNESIYCVYQNHKQQNKLIVL